MSVDIVNSQAILIPFLDIVRMVVAQSSDQIGLTASEIFKENVRADAHGSVRISVSGEVIPGAAQRGCPLYLRCSMPDLMR